MCAFCPIQERYKKKSRYCKVDAVQPDEDDVVRNVTISLRSRNAREKLLLYKARTPMKMIVGVQRLVLICPTEEIMQQLVNTDKSSEMMSGHVEHIGNDMEVPGPVVVKDALVKQRDISEDVEDSVVQKLVVTVVFDADKIVNLAPSSTVIDGVSKAVQGVELMRYTKEVGMMMATVTK